MTDKKPTGPLWLSAEQAAVAIDALSYYSVRTCGRERAIAEEVQGLIEIECNDDTQTTAQTITATDPAAATVDAALEAATGQPAGPWKFNVGRRAS